MQQRLLDIIVPKEREKDVIAVLEENELEGIWRFEFKDHLVNVRVIMDSDDIETVTDALEQSLLNEKDFRAMVLNLEASLPREKEKEEKDELQQKKKKLWLSRISREELFADVSNGAQFKLLSIAFVALATIVACTGMLESNVAMIIGAMVIAPLLGPIMGIALATTLASARLARQGLFSLLSGVAAALIFSVMLGIMLPIDPALPELALRTNITILDLIVALASGVAAALFFTEGLASAIIGVMVAVALLPPLAAAGLLFGAGYYDLGGRAILLFLVNLISINLAGVFVFAAQGVVPLFWWEKSKAKRMTYVALGASAILVLILAILIIFFVP